MSASPPHPDPGPALTRLSSLRVLVLGDVMLDRFVLGRVDRISPEAPVPVVSVHGEDARLGGAANVASNVAALGAQVTLAGVIGPGEAADHLLTLLGAAGIDSGALYRAADRPTTVKTRILGGGQQIVRIDRETRSPLTAGDVTALLETIATRGDFDVVVVSDYDKGVVVPEVMDRARRWKADGVPVVVDPKQADFGLYRGASCITPNAREAGAAVHEEVVGDASAERAGRRLRDRFETDMVLLTRGEQGMTLIDGDDTVTHLPTEATRVFDVTGAGDTVIATFAALLGAGAPAVEAARWANRAAGLAVRRLGTAAVGLDDLRRSLDEDRN
ncbi:MAG TPA: D-glycero-beta-D-manno-heptose-7-phosphate kinase [Candidatus Krumholzibacteria bacterium]|nr:D-glycero-beta-D-manno-heptose-7-phosphate kinase [Candidatus Krumholzibacteria bacterium]